MEAEEQADRAATEIVDLVEQEVQRSAGTPTGASLSPGMHIPAHSIATDTMERLAYAAQEEEDTAHIDSSKGDTQAQTQ